MLHEFCYPPNAENAQQLETLKQLSMPVNSDLS